jgi:membrane-associated phospholipid phosphatase
MMLTTDHRYRLRNLAILLWVFVGLMYVAMAIPSVQEWIQTIDDRFYTWVVDGESSPLVTVAKALSFIGSSYVMFPLVMVVAGYLYWKKRVAATWFWVSALAVSELLVWITKVLYARPRPPMGLVSTQSYSFPSGHADTAATVALGILFLLALRGRRHWYFDVFALMYVLAIAWSRVYLRVHWFSDVLTGAAIGASVVITAVLVVSMLNRRGKLPGTDAEDATTG